MNKYRHSRREFLGLTGAGVAGLGGASLLGTTDSVKCKVPTLIHTTPI